MRDKNRICLENRTYVGTSFLRIQVQNEVGIHVAVVRIKFEGCDMK